MKQVFVFGSNLAGLHGAGSALEALRRHGAISGLGVGPQGDSYAIPTKECSVRYTMPLHRIRLYVAQFLEYAAENLDKQFNVVAIGCGFAGYAPSQIGPMFNGYTPNVVLADELKPFAMPKDYATG